ncbi:ABC transporter permease [Apilactobacillus sp. TMW 2.2459]|uniref:ABC transporter permease n=1 Tax=Apilactobacillus xinyiensis TaxID=2841032 RepID=A0ABT0I1B4_9LACO|nr:ABC transporter permease [Apilactobacillus xinyiensis]MCK8624459.1 ABC transporter permease [Apilactobacillus xinyiensis]MCL0312054.1 ABC transporter permease [Apilactobacillus xinyiensis]MCL0318674.1 ABC transporter permease [Apilactobacillus xinyiensis]
MQKSLETGAQLSKEDLIKLSDEAKNNATPSTFKIIWKEFKADKMALFSLIFLIAFIVFVIVGSMFINVSQMMQTNIMNYFAKPFTSNFLLGADAGGRPILEQLIVGSRNSILIALGLTVISSAFGICYGLISGYFGRVTDLSMQRVYDFMMIIPSFMIIIEIVNIIPNYNAITLTLLLSLFYWMGTQRLIRSQVLAESQKDYVSASKTSGSSNLKIIFKQIMPNISSLIIVDTTISFAENIGVETGLSYLGFGLPVGTPSLGTLIANANDADNITIYWWTWLPATIEIILLCLAISYIGAALRRATNSTQRRSTD